MSPALESLVSPPSRGQVSPRLLSSSCLVRAAFLAQEMRAGGSFLQLMPPSPHTCGPSEVSGNSLHGGGYFSFLSTAKTQLGAAWRGQMLLVDGFNVDLLPSPPQ